MRDADGGPVQRQRATPPLTRRAEPLDRKPETLFISKEIEALQLLPDSKANTCEYISVKIVSKSPKKVICVTLQP